MTEKLLFYTKKTCKEDFLPETYHAQWLMKVYCVRCWHHIKKEKK